MPSLNVSGRRIDYDLTEGQGTPVVFLGGFMSDRAGSKATALEGWAKAEGRPYLRFDYSGHGTSSEAFTDGCIGDWYEDAKAMLTLFDEPVILVGSSMGGWISLKLARDAPKRVAGLVAIAAAPDFTEDGFWAGFTDEERDQLTQEGVVHVPSDYGDPYPITKHLIEDGRNHLLLRTPLKLNIPVRLLQGSEDADVPQARGVEVFNHIQGDDVRLTIVKGANHTFSEPENIDLIQSSIQEVSRHL